jgi:recombinational DNA repair protein (RecF pathway)
VESLGYKVLMQTKIEGILLSKAPFQDRHLMGHLLLRSGKEIPVCFYGGQGGGAKKKSSQLELGYMLKVELNRSKSTSDTYSAKEWLPLWSHKNIRTNHKAFSLLCLYLEVLSKLSQSADLHDEFQDYDDHSVGLFRVLSNAEVYLEKSLEEGNFDWSWHMAVFLAKLFVETGIFPDISHCVISGLEINKGDPVHLDAQHGGFAKISELGVEDRQYSYGQGGNQIRELLALASKSKYSDMPTMPWDKAFTHPLFNYFCYQYQFQMTDFKTFKMLF